MGLWSQIFAGVYDRVMRATEEGGLAERRRALLAKAEGRVLEIGAGTGANLAHYPAGVTQLTLTEPEEAMAKRLRRKLAASGLNAQVEVTPAERLPFEDVSFDVVVATLVLCTVDSVSASLAEIRRVLVPSGRLLLLEHVRSEEPALARRQDRFHGIWHAIGAGCHCNRDTVKSVASAGFEVGNLERVRMPKAVSIVKPMVVGSAQVGS